MADINLLRDGTFDFALGQNAWHSPDRIQANQYAAGVNLSCRGAILSPRAGFHQQKLVFANQTITTKYGDVRSIQDIWYTGKFQAAAPYYMQPSYYIISVISGLVFKTDINTLYTELVSDTLLANQFLRRINCANSGDTFVSFDYPNYPLLLKGTELKRSDPAHTVNGMVQPQIPVSTMGTYNQNRFFIANEGTELTGGDPVGNQLTPEAPVTFTEIFTSSSPYVNQSFSLSTDDTSHPISAMGFIQQLDQNTGIGPMFVATEKNVFFYKTNQPRANWTQGDFSGLLLANAGIAGQRAFVNVNSDLLFMSPEGQVHALSTARNTATKWGNTPISREVNNYLTFYDKSLAGLAVLGQFDNRIFISANPYRVQAQTRDGEAVIDFAHGGFVVLEIESLATLLTEGTPVWAGLWTGVNPTEIITVGGRCFITSKDGNGRFGYNTLYELKKDSTFDIVNGRKRRVRSICYTRQYNFGKDYEQKQEHTVVTHLQSLKGKVDYKVERKPSHSEEWSLWGEWQYEAPTSTPFIPDDYLINGFAPHQLKHVVFGDPAVDTCNPVTSEYYNTFSATQLRLTVEGEDWVLEDIKIEAQERPMLERMDSCDMLPVVATAVQCNPDWLIPEVEICEQSPTQC